MAEWSASLRSAKHEAILAVRLYNDPSEIRAFEAFVVHMHVAWLYLLHARFTKVGLDYRYPSKTIPGEYVMVDGEYRRWELARCVEERWPDSLDPVRKNLELFIGLRNRIEHRHFKQDVNLQLAVGGNAQAMLLNFEQEVVETFGAKHSLAHSLRTPLFIGTFTTEGEKVLKALRDKLPPRLQKFLADFYSGLTDETVKDPRFDMRLRVILESTTRGSDALALQFTRWDDMTDEEKAAAELLGRRGRTIIREQARPVVGHGLLRPSEAEQAVSAAIPFVFNSHHFLRSWQMKKIRPRTGAANPERTDERYCVYDQLSRQYGYTPAWVQWLIKHCATEAGFKATTGREAATK